MKLQNLAFTLTLAFVYSLQAQQSPSDMPGMRTEPAQPQPTKIAPTSPGAKPDHGKGCMEHRPQSEKSLSEKTRCETAESAAANTQDPERQQSGQSSRKPAPDSDASSIEVPVQELQEPEALGFHTGTDLPAPELLRDIVNRQPMTLEEFIEMAEKTNPTLAEAQRNVDRSRQQARQIGLPPDPVFGYSGDHIRGGEYGGGEEGAFFAQEIVLGRKLALRRDVYLKEGRANELAAEVQRSRVHNDVAQAFFNALAMQTSVNIYERLLKVSLDAEMNSHELERIGQADASDVLNSEIAAEQAKDEFATAQRTFLAAFAQLATLAGQLSLAPHPLSGALVEPPDLDTADLVSANAQDSPQVEEAQARVAVAEARLKSAQREKIPNLNLRVGEWYSGERLGATNIKAGPESFAEAGVQLPLWNRNQGNIEAARAELERSRQDVLRTQLLTQNRAKPLEEAYLGARSTAERYRAEMLPRARRAYELEVTKYQEMAQSYPHVLSEQHMLFTLQLTYLKALSDEWRAALALENHTLTDGLEEPGSIGEDSTTINLPTSSGGAY